MQLEKRQGNGGFLLIDSESKYGISHYESISPDNYLYKFYLNLKENVENNPNYVFIPPNGEATFSREKTEKFVHCVGCAAPKINNWRRYCMLCEDYFDK